MMDDAPASPSPPVALVEAASNADNSGDNDDEVYSVDTDAFESYSIDGEGEGEHAKTPSESCRTAETANDVNEDNAMSIANLEVSNATATSSSHGSLFDGASPETEGAMATQPERQLARSDGDPVFSYDESTYTIVSRLRAQNKRLVSQLEQHARVIQSLKEDKRQQAEVVDSLRSDVRAYKQTIKALETANVRGARCSSGQLTGGERPSTTPNLPHVRSLDSGSEVGRTASPRQTTKPMPPSSPIRELKVSSPREPVSPRSTGCHRSRGYLEKSDKPNMVKLVAKLEKAEEERKELVARHAHQLANYSHELSRLERQLENVQRTVQEKENELRLQRTRQLYHSPNLYPGAVIHSPAYAQPMAVGSRRESARRDSLHRSSVFSDDIWRDLLPTPPESPRKARRSSSVAALEPTTSTNFTSHVGQAFEQLLSHQLVALHDHALDKSARDWLFEVRSCGMQMLELHHSFQALGQSLKRLAEASTTYQLIDALTHESRVLVQAEQVLVFVADKAEQEFWCRMPRSGSQMVTVRSKLMPFGSASAPAGRPESPSRAVAATGPCGLASMVFHTKKPLVLAAGQLTKHPCLSSANDNTDRLVDHPSASTMLLPVMHDNQTLAVVQLVGKTAHVEALGLSIALEKSDTFTGEDQSLLALLCHFVSGLLPKVAYFTEVESNKVNEETLIQLAPEIFTCLRFDELGKIVIENAKDILDADRCSLFVADSTERILYNWQSDISGAGVEVLDASRKATMSIPFGHGIVGLVAETWQPINIVDAYDDPRFNSTWDKKTNYRTKSMLTVPILSSAIKTGQSAHREPQADANGRKPPSQTPVSQQQQQEQTLLGVVQVINKSGGAPFRSKDEFLLQTITKLIALAIENSQLFQKNQALCWDVGRLIADGDLVEAVISLGASAEEIIGVESACVYVLDESANEMVTFHRKRRYRIGLKPEMYRDSLFQDALQSKELLIVNDINAAPHFNAYVDSIAGIPAKNVLFAPLLVDDPESSDSRHPTKKLVGLLHLVNTKGRKAKFDRYDLFLSIVQSQSCSVVASILEKHDMLREKEQVTLLLDTSMSFFKEMSPVGVINAVYNSCTSIFSVEKAHLFLWEADRRHMWTSKIAPNAAVVPIGASPAPSSPNNSRNRHDSLNFVPTMAAQARRISVLTDERLRAPTTEGLLEKVLVHGTAIIVRHWIEPSDQLMAADPETTGPTPARIGRHMMHATASDVRLGFTRHSVLACPVWDNGGLEVVGVLVLLFKRGHAVQHSEELANLPILSRQIAGALNVCSDLNVLSARSRQLQSLLEVSRRKPEGGMSFTLSARGTLISFSEPLNVATAAFNVHALKTAMHGTSALNVGVHSLRMDEDGHRWGFQLSGAAVQDMVSEHCVQWVGRDLPAAAAGKFGKLVTDLQAVFQRKDVLRGAVDRGRDPEEREQDVLNLPRSVVVPIRQLLWQFVDSSWSVVAYRASRMFDAVLGRDPSDPRPRLVTRPQLEIALGESVQLDQMQWDLLHARFADPASDLVDAELMFETLKPRVRAAPALQYELVPVLDPVTQAVVGVHVLLRAAV